MVFRIGKFKNSIFSQSRLLQALQSQWNIFASPSTRIEKSRYDDESAETDGREFEDYDDQNDEIDIDDFENNPFKRRHHQHKSDNSTSTFLSTSLMRNSFRYASRRRYKTQSLANPYR